jgi:hypothetical protein
VGTYWRVYIVMVKPEGQNNYVPFVGSVGCVVAHETLGAARNALKVVRAEFANAYIQKCGAIS